MFVINSVPSVARQLPSPTAPRLPGVPGYERLRVFCRTHRALAEHHGLFTPVYAHRTPKQAAAYADVFRALRDELLPALLGGRWHRTERPLRAGECPFPYRLVTAAQHLLFDYTVGFRRAGSRGDLTWDTGAIIGQSYELWALQGRDDAPPRDAARGVAVALRQTLGVDIWAARGAAPWYPDHAALVLAARNLPADATAFGFVRLS